jgi:hypothetical protein
MKVAIVGLAPTSHYLAPWNDPEWELWGLPWDADRLRFHRTFEMHDMAALSKFYGDKLPGYLERLKDCASLYMQEACQEVGAQRYPLEEISKTCGDYFSSSIGYMLAMAIHEGAEEIGIYGVDMKAEDEYGYQKPNTEYLIGLARGKGVKVFIPEQSPLCKFGGQFGYVGRYGRTSE